MKEENIIMASDMNDYFNKKRVKLTADLKRNLVVAQVVEGVALSYQKLILTLVAEKQV